MKPTSVTPMQQSTIEGPTHYGAETIPTNTKLNYEKVKKCVCFSLIAFVVVFVVAYASLTHHHATRLVSTVSREVTRRRDSAVSKSSLSLELSDIGLHQCQAELDLSCDEQFGCVSYDEDVRYVMQQIYNNWDDLVDFVWLEAAIPLGSLSSESCMSEALSNMPLTCIDKCQSLLGYSPRLLYLSESDTDDDTAFAGQQMSLCKNTFLDKMRETLQPYRQSCIASLMAQQMSMLCGRSKEKAQEIEKAAFLWWKQEFMVSSSWTHSECPYYI